MKTTPQLFLITIILVVYTSLSQVFDVRNFGAIGDGIHDETKAINRCIEACVQKGGGTVRFPPGKYLTGTIRLTSNLTIVIEAGAVIIGTTNLDLYYHPTPPLSMPEAGWGKWHRGLIVGEGVERVTIQGPGIIDGNRVFDPTGEERMRGPHTIVLVEAKDIEISNLKIMDSANYAMLFLVSDRITVRNVIVKGGWDGVHIRGAPDRYCSQIKIINSEFYTGDDSIAGRYWTNMLIDRCIINSSCNGIRVIGPIQDTTITHSLFYGPGEEPHRTSNRFNMLSGIILQPGAWDRTVGLTDDIIITDVIMRNVASPITIWLREGNLAGKIHIDGVRATGVYRAALSAESWASQPITNIVIMNSYFQYESSVAKNAIKAKLALPGVDCRPLPAWAFVFKNADNVSMKDLRFEIGLPLEAQLPAGIVQKVNSLKIDNVRLNNEFLLPPSVVRLDE